MSEKIFLFDILEDIKYCPVLLNFHTELKNPVEAFLSIDKNYLRHLFEKLDSGTFHIIDISSCDSKDIGIDETVVDLLLKPKFFIICKEKIKNLIQKNTNVKSTTIPNTEEYLLCTNECMQNDFDYIFGILVNINKDSVEEYIYSQILCQFFCDDIKEHPEYSYDNGNYKYIESSNIYINKFINVKSIFLHNNYTNLVIDRMKELINRFKPNNEDFSLLGVSNTGIVLAQILGKEMGISVESLNRIGPVYCLSNSKGKVRKFKNKNYLLISDVVCLGGEFRITKGILDMVGASLIGGVCVVKIRDVYREGTDNELVVLAVVDNFSQKLISGEQIDYKILCDKEHSCNS